LNRALFIAADVVWRADRHGRRQAASFPRPRCCRSTPNAARAASGDSTPAAVKPSA
jgi:hypothetical protein